MGSAIDIIFGGMEDGWDYDAMDSISVTVSDAPKPDEILLVVAFLGGARPNARITGVSADQVAALVENLRAT